MRCRDGKTAFEWTTRTRPNDGSVASVSTSYLTKGLEVGA